MKRIIQILNFFAYGDAISNHTIAIYNQLQMHGFQTAIYANTIDYRLAKYAQPVASYDDHDDDIILYHLSTGSDLNRRITQYRGKIVINYHNITPAHFLAPYNPNFETIINSGYEDTYYLADKVAAAIVDSDYNGEELKKMGYTCPIYTVPIIIKFDDYALSPNPTITDRYRDGSTNIVFVGRIAPNKKHEDVILDFYYYNKYFNPNSRLFLVGNYTNFELYYLKLKKYVRALGLKNVYFTGHVSFKDILAYYKIADLFLCESEHEGFCVPLVEAMYFQVPVIAYDSSAVGETLADAGVLLKEKNPQLTASVIDTVIRNDAARKEMQSNGARRLDYFRSDNHINHMIEILTNI